MELTAPNRQCTKTGPPKTLTFDPAVRRHSRNSNGPNGLFPAADEDQLGKDGPWAVGSELNEEPFIRPSNDLYTKGCVEEPAYLMRLHPPAQPEPMPAPLAPAAFNSGSGLQPPHGRLLDGLLKQQDYIRLQQHHLQEMSRSLDNALHGSTEQPSPGFYHNGTIGTLGSSASFQVKRRSAGKVDCLGSPDLPTGKAQSLETMAIGSAQSSVLQQPHHFARRVSPVPPKLDGPMRTHSSFDANSERAYITGGASDIGAARSDLNHGTSERVIFTYSIKPKMATSATDQTEVAALSEASDKQGGGLFAQHVITRVASDRKVQASKLAARLQMRLGIHNVNSMVTARRLHNTLSCLGSTKYNLEDLNSMLSAINMHCGCIRSEDEDCTGVPFKDLVRFFLDLDDHRHLHMRSQFKEGLLDMMLAVREILVAGDANRLVAELTQVGVDEIAQRAPKDNLSSIMEPVMSFIIVLNSISIGMHANSDITRSDSIDDFWFWVDATFTFCFLLELLLKLRIRGCYWFWRGPDLYWNLFDFVLVVLALMDVILTLGWTANPQARTFGAIRVIRLTRLTRLFRVFRAKHLKELSLMVKGTMAGMRTLFWAILLLMFTVYVLGIFATATLSGNPPELLERDMFKSVPLSMFTVFRCLMGDCEDEHGRPLVFMYYQQYGAPFVIAYVFSTVMVVFGLFNLIFAIYIETTLEAAKTHRKMDRTESVRVARHTRELLKKFAFAHSLLAQQDPTARDTYGDTHEFAVSMQKSGQAAEIDEGGMKVSRELFELVLKDQEVQSLMDALDISPDRTHLFDILDADGSGTIEPAELIQGLLQVRGEAKKSDVVANLLAVRAVQNMIRQLEKDQADHRELITNVLQQVQRRGGSLASVQDV